MRDMLRNEIRYTNVAVGIPGDLDLPTGKLGPMSLFGAAEYAKDGLIAITELLGRTPWFFRMQDMTADLMSHAPVESAFGPLPDPGAELNGDVLQTLVRLATMTGDPRFLEWAERIGDAYVLEVLAEEPRPARLHLGLHEARGPRPHAPARSRQRDRGGAGLAARPRDRPGAAARRVLSRAGRPDARPHPGLGQSRRHALRRDPRLRSRRPRHAPLRQLGLRLRRGLHPLHGHGRGALSRCREARAAEPASLSGPRLGERQPGRLRRRDRERALSRGPRARARGHRLDRERDPDPDRLPAGGRDGRALVRRRQLGPDAPALRDVEVAGRATSRAGAKG